MLLVEDVGGLEVMNANAEWVPVPVKNHTFVMNTGTYFEHLSNGRWLSTIHRVRSEVRYQIIPSSLF
jgi:isopenicillin N synthase-like dioxygenase